MEFLKCESDYLLYVLKESVKDIDRFFDLDEYKETKTMTEYLGKNFTKETAYTLRCGGKGSPIDDRHNWDGYWVDGFFNK